MSKKHITEVEGSLKTLRKQVSEVERHLRNIRETEVSLGHWEPELERLRKSTDIQNDSQLDDLSRARERVAICKDVLQSAPAFLEEPLLNTISGIEALNESLLAASNEEREALIQEATVALIPFAGTHGEDSLLGTYNPARKIAENLPIVHSVPWSGSTVFERATLGNINEGRHVSSAESVLSSATRVISLAAGWLKNGGRFVTSKLQ